MRPGRRKAVLRAGGSAVWPVFRSCRGFNRLVFPKKQMNYKTYRLRRAGPAPPPAPPGWRLAALRLSAALSPRPASPYSHSRVAGASRPRASERRRDGSRADGIQPTSRETRAESRPLRLTVCRVSTRTTTHLSVPTGSDTLGSTDHRARVRSGSPNRPIPHRIRNSRPT